MQCFFKSTLTLIQKIRLLIAMEQITYKEVYNRFWECWKIELSNFWQRAIFLGAFLTLSYAGYGALCLHGFDIKNEFQWNTFHLLACGITCFGMLLSALWVLMAKGSKAWYEYYEAAILAMRQILPEDCFEHPNGASCRLRQIAMFGIGAREEFRSKWKEKDRDNGYFSPLPGCFSVSKVTICLGQLSLIGWFLLAGIHLTALAMGEEETRQFVQTNALEIALFLLLLSVIVIVHFQRNYLRSGILSEIEEDVSPSCDLKRQSKKDSL